MLDKTTTRKLMQSMASFGPALMLLQLAGDQGSGAHSLTQAVAMITVWLALSGFSASGEPHALKHGQHRWRPVAASGYCAVRALGWGFKLTHPARSQAAL